jgi:hypothetical protein
MLHSFYRHGGILAFGVQQSEFSPLAALEMRKSKLGC